MKKGPQGTHNTTALPACHPVVHRTLHTLLALAALPLTLARQRHTPWSCLSRVHQRQATATCCQKARAGRGTQRRTVQRVG